jgi:dihydroflavonol-4-reductase
VAGTTRLRASLTELMRVNVEGTRLVMEEALRAGVERVVHTSSIGAVGPAPPNGVVDERNAFPPGLGVPYAESKHAAETEALRVAARGLPVVIVCPAHVFGRGDAGPTSTGVVRRFLLRRIPAYVPGAINVVDVADVAAGHLLADERGTPGERYILGTRNYTWERLFAELERLSGIEGPPLEVPVALALPLAEAAAFSPFPSPVSPEEVRAAGYWWTCKSTKARRELGWTTRPHEDTVEETVRWWEERLGARLRDAPRGQRTAWKLVAAGARAAEGIGGRIFR